MAQITKHIHRSVELITTIVFTILILSQFAKDSVRVIRNQTQTIKSRYNYNIKMIVPKCYFIKFLNSILGRTKKIT